MPEVQPREPVRSLPLPCLSCTADGEPSHPSGGRTTNTDHLFSDLVGYVDLNQRHDPDAVELVMDEVGRRAQEIIERHGGQITQILGDEIMSLFGYPQAHDDDSVRCARAARELHAMVRELSADWVEPVLHTRICLHSGFATGEVTVFWS